MTEDEAKTKWCPMVRYGTQGRNETGGANKPETDAEKRGLACLGSACMMWRWQPKMINVSTKNSWVFMRPTGETTTDGYCGLAGKP